MGFSSTKLTLLAALIVLAGTSLAPQASGQNYSVLYTFSGGTDGSRPNGNLVFDSSGNLYGTTNAGGNFACTLSGACGIVFELSPNIDGTWTKTTLHSFIGNNGIRGYDGAFPNGGLVIDQLGNIYGTTVNGGFYGYGTVFQLMRAGQGWKENILLSFNVFQYGADPNGGLLIDRSGNLYGTTSTGGTTGCGGVFELSPNSSGQWTATILYAPQNSTRDGCGPSNLLATDSAGNLYATTVYGGPVSTACPSGCGVIFEVSRTSSGGWTGHTIHYFGNTGDGWSPSAGLTSNPSGGFYGTTSLGGTLDRGTVFQITGEPNGGWSESVLHSFEGANHQDPSPTGNVVLDPGGNIYGAAGGIDPLRANGALYELFPNGDGTWSESIPYAFSGHGDGADPTGGLILDASGNLYGATIGGGDNLGTYGDGVIFELMP